MRVAHLTTSYPRYPGDAAGRFVADAVERLRRRIEVEVVSPQDFRGRRVTIIGLGKGRATAGIARFAVANGAQVTIANPKVSTKPDDS